MKLDKSLRGERIVICNYKKPDSPLLIDMWLDEENGKNMADPCQTCERHMPKGFGQPGK